MLSTWIATGCCYEYRYMAGSRINWMSNGTDVLGWMMNDSQTNWHDRPFPKINFKWNIWTNMDLDYWILLLNTSKCYLDSCDYVNRGVQWYLEKYRRPSMSKWRNTSAISLEIISHRGLWGNHFQFVASGDKKAELGMSYKFLSDAPINLFSRYIN